MFSSQSTKLYLLLLIMILLTACAGAEPTPAVSAVAALPPGAPTPVVVRILNLDLVLPSVSPTLIPPSPTPLPTLPPLPTPAPVSATSTIASTSTTPACTNAAEFVKNLSIADNTAFKPGQSFAKIWQIKNTGTCTWTTEYSLVYASGEAMGSPAFIPIPHTVQPGETVDLRLSLVAPANPNTYTGGWYLRDATGTLFGLGPDRTQPLGVTIVVRPEGEPSM